MGRKRRRKIYYNSDADTTTDDSREQLYLTPAGTSDKSDVLQQELAENEEANKEFHEELSAHNDGIVRATDAKDKVKNAYGRETGRRKYRKYIEKDVQTEKLRKMASDALERSVPLKDFQEELHDDGIGAKEYAHETMTDYRQELIQKEIPVKDRDKDGDIDKDDVEITPAMTKMSKFI